MPSYEQRGKDKTWTVRFIEDGRNIRLSGFRTKKEAREAYEVRRVNYQPAKEHLPKFSEIYTHYLDYAKSQMKEASLYDLKSRAKNHILPAFGNLYCDEITKQKALEWQNEKTSVYSRKYVIVLRSVFGSVWSFGEHFYNLGENPFNKIKRPKENPKAEMNIWTPEEFQQFTECAQDEEYRLFFKTLYYTGMRKGEALALTPDDIGTDSIRINKSLTRKGNEAWAVTTPKTQNSIRAIVAPLGLCSELKNKKGKFVFGGDTPLPERTIDRKFEQYTKAAGLKHIRIHDLRHSHASLLISQGVSIVAVSKRLGHKSTQMTLDTYSHMLPSDDKIIANLVQHFWV